MRAREALGLPYITALRRIKRLESMGFVGTEMTPGGLLVVLLRK
jgi:DNA-binding MarR family transcriptional regulator